MKMNPIYKKELRLGSRTIKMPLAIMAYNILLAFIALVAIYVCAAISSVGEGYSYQSMMALFPIIGCVECGIVILMIPIITAGSISGERERQTLDIMLTTPVKPMSIVMGKLITALTQVLMFVISSIPIISIAFILGGLNWFALLGYIIIMIYISIYVGSIGIFCSSVFKKTIVSIIVSLIIIIAIFSGTAAVTGITAGIWATVVTVTTNGTVTPDLGPLPFFMLLNPLTTLGDFLLRVFNAGSISELCDQASMGKVWVILAKFWIPLSAILNLLVSWGFLALAAKRINPLKKVKA